MLPEKYDNVGNAWDDDMGVVVEIYRDEAKVKWDDGSVTHEPLSMYGDKDYWFPYGMSF